MVATVAKKGYGATTVADLVELSGVSRSAFYRHFADKQECFLAAVEALVEPILKSVTEGLELGDEESAKQAFEVLAKLIADQPAAAKMCFEVYAAGPEGVERRASGVPRRADVQRGRVDPERAGEGRLGGSRTSIGTSRRLPAGI